VNHRVRNMLTAVNAIATQTGNRAESLAEFKEAFFGLPPRAVVTVDQW
jgi:hypothetical protein